MEQDNRGFSALIYSTIAIVILLCVAFAFDIGGVSTVRPLAFSKRNMLQALWYQYKNNYLEQGTLRSLDKQRQNVTTSEGQSYTMLRAVWMDDKSTFDSVWQWTKDNIQRKDDHLMSWLFGERKNGTYGVLTDQGGYNTASDADEDIAMSLLFAWKRWNDQRYFGDAIVLVRDIWNKEVVMIGGKPYLAADDVEKSASKRSIVVNPSYLSPYAYKIFAQVDPSHDWLALASTSYDVIDASMRLGLDKGSTSFLPPDWIAIDRATGSITAPAASTGLSTDFSFDAIRVPWRLALDYSWTADPRDKRILSQMGFLQREWQSNHSLSTAYTHDGKRTSQSEALSTYGGAIGYFMVSDPGGATAIYAKKLEGVYDPNESKWSKPESYYNENWAWFGMALYDGELDDLFNNAPR